jgi:hypothetical protein
VGRRQQRRSTLNLRVASLLALVVQQMTVSCSGPGELSSAVGARRLGGLARLLSLVPQQVAEGGELAAIAAVLPAPGLGAALDDANVAALGRGRGAGEGRGDGRAASGHDGRDLVHHGVLVANRQ